MPVAQHFLDMMSDTISAQPGTEDGTAKFTAVGPPITGIPCHISGANKIIKDRNGAEKTASLKVTTGDNLGLTPEGHRYFLPARYPSTLTDGRRALSTRSVQDASGPHHEVLMFE